MAVVDLRPELSSSSKYSILRLRAVLECQFSRIGIRAFPDFEFQKNLDQSCSDVPSSIIRDQPVLVFQIPYIRGLGCSRVPSYVN
jgi:hypothetical protein